MAERKTQETSSNHKTSGGCETPRAIRYTGGLRMRGKVVLFYPQYEGPALGAPLCLLSLASPLLQAGFEVRIVDAAVVPNWESKILTEIQDALCLGISVLTGPMIRGAVRVAKAAKRTRPDMPVIFGGWHPSLLPDRLCVNTMWMQWFAVRAN